MEDKFDLAGNQLLGRQQQLDQLVTPSSSSSSKPSLGKCWEAVPTIRLTIEDPFYEAILNVSAATNLNPRNSATEQIDKNERIVRVVKSCFGPTGCECVVRVADIGMH